MAVAGTDIFICEKLGLHPVLPNINIGLCGISQLELIGYR